MPGSVVYSVSLSFLLALLASGTLLYFQFTQIRLVRFGMGILGHFLLFAGLGLVIAQLESVIVSFIIFSAFSLVVGILHVVFGKKSFPWFAHQHLGFGFLTIFMWAVWSVFSFAFVYGLLSETASVFLPYLIVGITPFLLPFVLRISYFFWQSIPKLRYKRWHYDVNEALPILEPINLMKVNVQFTKVPDESDPSFEGYFVELPGDVALGFLYQYFIYSHNNRHRDYKKSPIMYQVNARPLGWVLFKKGVDNQRIYLDTSKSLRQNSIMQNDTILAQSYSD